MARGEMNTVAWIATVLVIIGGINWGLVGVFGFNLVEALLGVDTMLTTIVYSLVGISALYAGWKLFT